jgi:hypothetical protein
MRHYCATTLLVSIPLAAVLAGPPTVTARDDESYEREERRSSARLSERDRRSLEDFLDAHRETARELEDDPELINSKQFLRGHQDLRDWLEDHPDAAEALRADPRAALRRERTSEEREERRPGSARLSEQDLASFERYLDEHWETAQPLYKEPELIKDRRFLREHASLRDWLQDHPDAAEAIQANPHKFLWRERSGSPQDFLRQLLR